MAFVPPLRLDDHQRVSVAVQKVGAGDSSNLKTNGTGQHLQQFVLVAVGIVLAKHRLIKPISSVVHGV